MSPTVAPVDKLNRQSEDARQRNRLDGRQTFSSPVIFRRGSSVMALVDGPGLSGLGRLLGSPQAIGAELARAAAGYAAIVRIAIARSQTAARLLAIAHVRVRQSRMVRRPRRLRRCRSTRCACSSKTTTPRREIAARVKATVDRLDTFRRWGLTTLGEIAALPPMDLSERMGQEGLALQQLARGVDRAPLVPDPGVPRFMQSMELEWPIDALEPLSFVFARLLDPLSSALERADRGAAALRLDSRLVDRTMHARVLQLPAACATRKCCARCCCSISNRIRRRAAIDIVTIEIDPVPGRIVQYSLLERALPSPETLATLTARLGALVGERRCGSPVLLDTWRPDGFEIRRFAPSFQLPASSFQFPVASREDRSPDPAPRDPGSRSHGSRQALTSQLHSLRRFRPPVAVRVTVDRGRPVRVAIDRRGMPGGQCRVCRRPVAHVGRVVGAGRPPGIATNGMRRSATDRSAGCSTIASTIAGSSTASSIDPVMYVELHAASAFSFLDGASLPEALVDRAAALGYPALALLDRDGVYGAPRFHLAAKRAGIKAIIGAELTIGAIGDRRVESSGCPCSSNRSEGYRNLCRLVTRMKLRAPKGEGALALEELDGHVAGLVALVGAPRSAVRDSASADSSIGMVGTFGARQRVHRTAASPVARGGSRQPGAHRSRRRRFTCRSWPPTACASPSRRTGRCTTCSRASGTRRRSSARDGG